MAILFDFYETPLPSEDEGADYHVRTVITRTVRTEEIIERLTLGTTLTPGDIKNALVSLSDMLAQYMSESESVHLEGIGFFQPTLYSKREIEPDKTRAQSIWFKTVKFKPDTVLVKKMKGVPTERSLFKRHSVKRSEEDIDKLLTRFFAEYETLTRRRMESLCGMTQITAIRHINRLLAEGKIRNIHLKRQPVYVPAPGFYGTPEKKE